MYTLPSPSFTLMGGPSPEPLNHAKDPHLNSVWYVLQRLSYNLPDYLDSFYVMYLANWATYERIKYIRLRVFFKRSFCHFKLTSV